MPFTSVHKTNPIRVKLISVIKPIIRCALMYFSYHLRLKSGLFMAIFSKPSGWTHLVLNYLGSRGGQGISIYYNGHHQGGDTDMEPGSYSGGNGKVVAGRQYTDRSEKYSKVEIDELAFFNARLEEQQIMELQVMHED